MSNHSFSRSDDHQQWEFSTTGEIDIKIIPKEEWQNKLNKIIENSNKFIDENFEEGELFKVEILAPKEMCGGDAVTFSSVMLEQHNKDCISVQYEMIKIAREFISNAYILGSLDSALPKVLGSIIEGKGLYENNIGEFFLLYGRFEQKCKQEGKKPLQEMKNLVQDNRTPRKIAVLPPWQSCLVRTKPAPELTFSW